MMAKFILSPEAQNSLKSIQAYSIKNFGIKRAKLTFGAFANDLMS